MNNLPTLRNYRMLITNLRKKKHEKIKIREDISSVKFPKRRSALSIEQGQDSDNFE